MYILHFTNCEVKMTLRNVKFFQKDLTVREAADIIKANFTKCQVRGAESGFDERKKKSKLHATRSWKIIGYFRIILQHDRKWRSQTNSQNRKEDRGGIGF